MGTQQGKSLLLNKNSTKYKRKPSLHLIVQGRLFYYAFSRKGGDFLTIEEYIKSKEKFKLIPFVTIYTAIMELIDELVEAVKILHPRMYTTFIDKVQDL